MTVNAFANLESQEDGVINVRKTFGTSEHKDVKHVGVFQKGVLTTRLRAIPILATVIVNKMLKVIKFKVVA